MAKVPERDASLLLDMLLAANDAQSFIAGLDQPTFLTSRLHQNAVIRSLEVIGEAAGKGSSATRDAHPEISWRDIEARVPPWSVAQKEGDRARSVIRWLCPHGGDTLVRSRREFKIKFFL